jgi:hypothetical protein
MKRIFDIRLFFFLSFLQIDIFFMSTIDDHYQSYPLIKQSKVRKLCTYTSSVSSSGSGSSTNNSPNVNKQKVSHHNGDTDEGYASFTTTNSTTLPSNNSTIFNKDDSAYYTSGSERLFVTTNTSSSSSKLFVESDSETSDDDEVLKDLVDWPSLNQQVQTLVSRLDKWLHNPLPDRSIPIETSYVEHAYPILQRRTYSTPLSINLASDQSDSISNQSNYLVNFVQNNEIPPLKPNTPFKIPRPHVHFNLQANEVGFFSLINPNNSFLFFLCLASALYNLFSTDSINSFNEYTTDINHLSLL